MRAMALLILATIILVLVGWITFYASSDRAGIHIETEKVEQDTKSLIEAGREMVHETGTALEAATDDADADATLDVDRPNHIDERRQAPANRLGDPTAE